MVLVVETSGEEHQPPEQVPALADAFIVQGYNWYVMTFVEEDAKRLSSALGGELISIEGIPLDTGG